MLSNKIENILNKQIAIEAESSQFYLAMASWAENQGLSGTTSFLYQHSNEERMHMLKLVKYVNERGGKAKVPALPAPPSEYAGVREVFEKLLAHEEMVTNEINHVIHLCLQEKDYTTHNFMQWYVSEQIEEEALARSVMDRLNLIGDESGGLYLFDRDLEKMPKSVGSGAQQA
ncbi:MAG: ferritin [Sphingobacteriales bacterium]|jgi:ferritin